MVAAGLDRLGPAVGDPDVVAEQLQEPGQAPAASTLSSTTRIRDGPTAALPSGSASTRPGASAASARGGRGAGRRTRCPGRARRSRPRRVPPCISTRFLTRVRPIPRPPSERSSERSTWAKRSKIRGEHLGGDADAVVADPDDDHAAVPARRSRRDRAARLGVLGGVGQEVDEDLLEPGRVGLDRRRSPGEGQTRESCPRASISGRTASTARRDDRRRGRPARVPELGSCRG